MARPLTIMVVSHMARFKTRQFKFTLSFLLTMFALWTLITLWAGYSISVNFNYNLTRADNKLLKTKFAFVAKKLDATKKYIEMTHQANSKIRQMLKMGSEDNIIKGESIGGATYDEKMDFKKMISAKASQISEKILGSNIEYIARESKKALASFQDITWYVTNKQNIYRATPSIWPTSGRITSSFGYRIITVGGTTGGEFHEGIDIGNKANTPIYATADGVVRITGWAKGYGQAIVIDHGFGYSTLYAHTTEIKVKPGEYVKRGEMIARMGTTGRSKGVHLHYEIWRYDKAVNPMGYLKVGQLERKDTDFRDKLQELI